MRLTVPDPDITLYEDGFAKHDQLDRKATGDKLSDLVERQRYWKRHAATLSILKL